jgi:hypothetical protein
MKVHTRPQPRLMPLPATVLVSARWSSTPPDRVRAGGGGGAGRGGGVMGVDAPEGVNGQMEGVGIAGECCLFCAAFVYTICGPTTRRTVPDRSRTTPLWGLSPLKSASRPARPCAPRHLAPCGITIARLAHAALRSDRPCQSELELTGS